MIPPSQTPLGTLVVEQVKFIAVWKYRSTHRWICGRKDFRIRVVSGDFGRVYGSSALLQLGAVKKWELFHNWAFS